MGTCIIGAVVDTGVPLCWMVTRSIMSRVIVHYSMAGNNEPQANKYQ